MNICIRYLQERLGQHPHVGDIRGRGLFWGVEFVKDRETKECFDPTLKIHARLKAAAFDAGLICYPMGGTIDGRRGDHVLLGPALHCGNLITCKSWQISFLQLLKESLPMLALVDLALILTNRRE